jgi:hypothetical protein
MIPKELLAEITRWMVEKRYGNLQINFCAGKIVNVNRVESIKLELLVTGAISSGNASLDTPST